MSRLYRSKKQYIESLQTVLEAVEEFKSLEYCRMHNTNEEYMKMSSIIGDVWFFDITGYTEALILHCIAQIECGIIPTNKVSDPQKKLEIGKMFNQ